MDPATQGPAIRARLGVCPQEDTLDPELTARENLTVYGRYFGLSRRECASKADELLAFTSLTEKAASKTEALSGGMRRRLTIARSLINDPDVLLLDEPTTGLDPQARHLVWDRLFRLKQSGVTLVLTTHYMDEAEQLCDRLVVIDQGVIVAAGSPRELIKEHSTREVAELRFGSDDAPDGHEAIAAQHGDRLADLGERLEALPDRLLLYTDDGDAATAACTSAGCAPPACWCAGRLSRTCSCGSPAGRWSTDMGIPTTRRATQPCQARRAGALPRGRRWSAARLLAASATCARGRPVRSPAS